MRRRGPWDSAPLLLRVRGVSVPGSSIRPMSVIGEYARLTPAELKRAVRDPSWALEYIDELTGAGAAETTGASQPRCLDIDKACDALGFQLPVL
jgi:Domain of unknown function (DUF1877)